MPELPPKPILELGQGIEVEGSMEADKTVSGSDRNDPNVKHVDFVAPDTIEHTGETNDQLKPEDPEKETEQEPKEEVENNLLEFSNLESPMSLSLIHI